MRELRVYVDHKLVLATADSLEKADRVVKALTKSGTFRLSFTFLRPTDRELHFVSSKGGLHT